MGKIKLRQSKETTLADLFTQFENYNKAKNLSKATLKHYSQYYNCLVNFFGENYKVSLFNEQAVYNYINHFRDNTGCGDIAINTALSFMRTFIYYGIERGYIESFKIHLIKTDKPIKETYSEEELKILLKKPNMKKADFSTYRNWTLTNFLIGTGVRASTLCNIKIKDVSISGKEIILRHMKARKQIIIPLSSSLTNILIEYLSYRGGKPDDYLFCDQKGEFMTYNTLKFAIRRYNQRRGIEKSSIHLYRHSFARYFIKSGGDLYHLMRLLGHATVQQTIEYINLFGNDLSQDYDRFCPLETFIPKEHIKLKR